MQFVIFVNNNVYGMVKSLYVRSSESVLVAYIRILADNWQMIAFDLVS